MFKKFPKFLLHSILVFLRSILTYVLLDDFFIKIILLFCVSGVSTVGVVRYALSACDFPAVNTAPAPDLSNVPVRMDGEAIFAIRVSGVMVLCFIKKKFIILSMKF